MSKRTRVQPAKSRRHQFHQPERLEDRLAMDGTGFVHSDPPEDPESIVGQAGIVANDDYIRSPRGAQSIRISPLLNDQLPAGAQKLSIKLVSDTANGATVTISDDGQHLIYTPTGDEGLQGWDSLYYIVQTEDGLLGKANVQLGLKHQSADVMPPIHQRRYPDYQVLEDSDEQLLNVLGTFFNSSDYHGATITSVTAPEGGGSIRISDSGRGLWYQPEYGFVGRDDATITLRAEDGAEYEFSVRITVKKPYDTLSYRDDTLYQRGTGPYSISPLGNDKQLRPFEITPYIESASVPAYAGSVVPTENGQGLTFAPNDDFEGRVRITYMVRYGEAPHQTVTSVLYASVYDSFKAVENYFLVEPNSPATELDVLANDPVFSPFTGMSLQIVEVSTASAGGQVTHDGKTIRYQPAAGFEGDETFTYTAEFASGARQTAQVTVEVAPRVSNPLELPQFATQRELEQYLIDRAVAYYGNAFGEFVQKYAPLPEGAIYYSPIIYDTYTVSLNAADFSETNTQVAGVDEADIVETDGRYVYSLSHGRLTIVDLQNPKDPKLVSVTELDASINTMYLQGDRLTLLHNGSDRSRYIPFGVYGTEAPEPDPGIVWVLDITDRTAPAVVERTEIDGIIADSRAIGSKVHLVVQRAIAYPELGGRWVVDPIPAELPDENAGPTLHLLDRGTPGVWANESLEDYLDRVRAQLIETGLPTFKTYDAAGQLVASGLLGSATSLHKAIGGDDQVVSLLTIDTMDDTSGPAAEATSFLADGQSVVYVSTDSIYLFAYDYATDTTTITKLAMADDGTLPLVATGQIRGRLLNQFSADEYDGRLRVATTQQERELLGNGITWRQRRLFNILLVLEQNGTQLAVVGEVTNLAPTETIKSVRFMGERAYVVTFRVVDPLFAIDLSDPTNPTVRGALKIPGYSDYLHPVGSNYLLGIGRDADEITGRLGAFQITLFDVSDLDKPEVADQVTFEGTSWTSSEAWIDHHAVAFFEEEGVLAVPLTWNESFARRRNDGTTHQTNVRHEATWTFKIKTDGKAKLQTLGSIEHPQTEAPSIFPLNPIGIDTIVIDWTLSLNLQFARPTMQRALRIDNVLVTVSNDWLEVHRLNNPEKQLAQLRLGAPVTNDNYTIEEDSGFHTLDVLANDPPNATGALVTIIGVDDVVGGTADIAEDGKSIRFTPNKDFFGSASFRYAVDAPLYGEVSAYVRVNVTAVPDDPKAVDDSYTLNVSAGTTELDVLANDLNPDYHTDFLVSPFDTSEAADFRLLTVAAGLTISEVSPSEHGAVVEISDHGTIAYTAADGFEGVDTFTYTIVDNLGRTDTATVTVFVGVAPPVVFESPTSTRRPNRPALRAPFSPEATAAPVTEPVVQDKEPRVVSRWERSETLDESLFVRGIFRPARKSDGFSEEQFSHSMDSPVETSWALLVDAVHEDTSRDDLTAGRPHSSTSKLAAHVPPHSIGFQSSVDNSDLASPLGRALLAKSR